MTKEKKQSNIIQAIKKEIESEHNKRDNIISDCSETNCSNYCSDHHDADH